MYKSTKMQLIVNGWVAIAFTFLEIQNSYKVFFFSLVRLERLSGDNSSLLRKSRGLQEVGAEKKEHIDTWTSKRFIWFVVQGSEAHNR